ncbi:unnamed protein product, partial [Pylaiella littoralis]
RRKSGGQLPARSPAQDPGEGGRRRASAPGRRRSLSRRRLCGRDTCGWRLPGPDIVCTSCPGGVVHNEGVDLCSACHRTLSGQEVAHLGEDRLTRTLQFVTELRSSEGGGWPPVLSEQFRPSSDCLCKKPDYFNALLKVHESRIGAKNGSVQSCAVCSKRGSGMRPYDAGSGAGKG